MAGIDLGGVLEIDSLVITTGVSGQGPGQFLGLMDSSGNICNPGSAGSGSSSSSTLRNYSF